MFKVTRLLSWNSSTEALPATADFYRTLFGATLRDGPTTERRSDGTEVTISRIALNELSLGFYDWSGGRRPAWDHHTFEIAWPGDPEAVKAELERRGVQIEGVRPHAVDAGYSIVLRDPAGNRVEFSAIP
ncbi:MAG: Glyoxalase/Bleomycin resistance protein/Dioxygenase superfamily [Chloroflexota bacterium]|jgi:predicted enzyme related to lactoylglutathione lyase|nr:Glyoxalase/Bleomycin resistance protein/Dioxygenase superfamily [Chloroflexota bacterium]